jgi:rhodanese-related sulfurtransferase
MGFERKDGGRDVLNLRASVALASLLACQCVCAQPAQDLALPAQAFFRDVRLTWENRQLIFFATFQQDGHDAPLWLECQSGNASKAAQGIRAQIDYVEQYGRRMPVAVRLISLEKSKNGQPVLFLGQPAPNTLRLEGANANCSLEVTDMEGRTDRYSFSLTDTGALPRLSGVK